jgi:hypothetical protein
MFDFTDGLDFQFQSSAAGKLSTKVELINKTYSMGRISGLTSQPTNEDITLALDHLESLAAEWAEQNICVGYNFEDQPAPNSTHNIPRKYWAAFQSNLMIRLMPDFGKEPSRVLMGIAATTFSRISARTAIVPKTDYPNRQPLGSGNTRYSRFQRFYRTFEKVPTECETVRMAVGDIREFFEDFSSYLISGEDITSYTIEVEDGLTIITDYLNSPRIIYKIEATGNNTTNQLIAQVKIVATTTSQRVETRIRNFTLIKVELDS